MSQPQFASPDLPFETSWGSRDDSAFIAEAYRRLLGRPADPKGFASCMAALRAGQHRYALLAAMLLSEEAEAHLGAEARNRLRQGMQVTASSRWRARLSRKWRTLAPRRSVAPTHGFAPPPARPEVVAADQCANLPSGGSAAHGWHRVIFTIAARNYLPQVRVLMASVLRHEPSCLPVLVLVDSRKQGVDAQSLELDGRIRVVGAEALPLQTLDDMGIRYTTLELCTALKPAAVRALLIGGTAACQVIYLDPDIELHAPLDTAFEALESGASIAVTPHMLGPLEPRGQPSDHDILKCGVFNLGFFAARRCDETDRFLAWWGRQVETGCLVAFEKNLFTDQRWCDLLPSFVEKLAVLRHPGLNVAYWNLEQRSSVSQAPNTDRSNRLIFFHFSGFDPRNPSRASRYQTRLTEQDLEHWLPVLRAYAQRLLAAGWRALSGPATPMEMLPSGAPFPALLRAHYRKLWPKPAAARRDFLLHTLLHEALTVDPETGLPHLLHTLHDLDPEVKAAFDLADRESCADFADWVRLCAREMLELQGLCASSGDLDNARHL